MAIATRLTNTGTFLVNGSFDELTDGIVYDSSLKLYLNAVKSFPLVVQYVIVGGGGAGGRDGNDSGGGGAGGYRSSVTGELSGGNSTAETPLTLIPGSNYSVSIGNGGAGTGAFSSSGSTFNSITAQGGGVGAAAVTAQPAVSGGSGGGGSSKAGQETGAAGTSGQGFAGGNFVTDGGGGGGAGSAGYNGNDATKPGYGGDGIQSNITGTPTYYAGGGGGGVDTAGRGIGGAGGGGNGSVTGNGGNATGYGSGGGGSGGTGTGGNGSAGVVILRYPNIYTISLTNCGGTTTTVGSDKVTVIDSSDAELEASVSWSLTSSSWSDLSGNGNTATLVASPTFTTSGGGAITFNPSGTGQYANIPVAAIPSGGNQVSISCWINLGNPATPPAASVFSCSDSVGNRIINIHLPWNDSIVYWDAGNSGGTYDRINTSTLSLAQKTDWHHWAFTKNATTGTMAIYLDGVSIATGTGKTLALGTASTATVPCAIANFQGTANWNGSVGSFEIYNVALTATQVAQNYSATSAPYTKFKTASNTVYATEFDEKIINGGSVAKRELSTGVLQVSDEFDEVSLTAGSISFNGTTQYLTVASNNIFTPLQTGIFTVEAWIYVTGGSGTQREIVVRHNPGSSLNWMLELTAGNLASFYFNGVSGGESISSVATVPSNRWVHVAGGISGVNKFVCLDGVYRSAAYTSAPVLQGAGGTTLPIVIGAAQNGSLGFTGLMSNVRGVNGTALYTANYTPSRTVFPAITDTFLLLNVIDSTNFIRDNSKNTFTITNNGTATFNTSGPFNGQ